MIIKKISLENIRSYTKKEVDLSGNSILLSGDIGSGKTSILLAIEFALFGLQPGQRGSSLLRNGTNSGKVSLLIEIDGQPLEIRRHLKRSNKTVTQEAVTINIGGKEEELAITEAKNRILSLLNYPAEFLKKTNYLYRFTVYSPQEEMKNIILEAPEARLNVIRTIFGIDRYKRIKENSVLFASNIREDIKLLNYEVKDLPKEEEYLKSTTLELEKLEEDINFYRKQILDKKNKRKSIEQELTEHQEKITEKSKLEQEIEKIKVAVSSKKIYLNDLLKEEKYLTDKFSKVQSTPLGDLEKLSKIIADKKLRIAELNSSILTVSSLIGSTSLKIKENSEKKNRIFKIEICPTCLQTVGELHKHNIENEVETSLSDAKKNLQAYESQLTKLTSELKNETSLLERLDLEKKEIELANLRLNDLKDHSEKISQIKKLTHSLNQDIALLEGQISLLRESTFELSKYSNIYAIKEKELKNAFNEEKNSEIELATTLKEKELKEKQLKDISSQISSKKKKQEKLGELIEMESWFSNEFLNFISFLESQITYRLRKNFSNLFNKWFEMLTSESFLAQVDENFTPIILQNDYEIDYEFLSGGERTAVALAYRLALNQLINSVYSKIKTKDIVILDEPTDGFSDQQLNKMRDVFNELKLGQIIIVSHEQKIESFVDRVIKLKKTQGLTDLEE